nr:retrovirus-related Pol polyprotein from transposon TNT 1-94 [Tanacetum cinerariifolium]
KFFDEVGITQQFSAARTPQQNGVVERRNRTLVEATRTMLTFANLPLFVWVEAITTACFTQNCLIIHKHFDKTPYELINNRKPNIKFFCVFRCRCYLLNDYEDVGKLKAKGDIGVFVGYSKEYAAFRNYNKRTRESSSSSLNDDVEQSPEEVILPQTNTQSIPINMVPDSNEASTSHNVFNERLEDAYFDASTSFHDSSNVAEALRDADWEEVYVGQPPGFVSKHYLEHVYALDKALYGTINLGLWYPKDSGFDLTAYSDADHAGCHLDRKTESEYVAVSSYCAKVLWMRTQLTDYGFFYDKVPIYCDSKSAIAISCNLIQIAEKKIKIAFDNADLRFESRVDTFKNQAISTSELSNIMNQSETEITSDSNIISYSRDEIIPFVKALKDLFNSFDQFLIDELTDVQNVFNQIEQAVEQHCVKKNKFQDKMNDVLKENERLLEQAISADILNIVVNANVNYAFLGKPMSQSHRNQLVVRQPTAFKSERPRISKAQCDSQVDVNYNLLKPVSTHYLPKEREAASEKPHHMIASSNSRFSSKNITRFSSNDMIHNHYLEEAKKRTQEHSRNSEPNLVTFARLQSTANGSKPKPRWKLTGKIFKTYGLRWVHTGKIFASSITKVDSEPLNGSNTDMTNQYECEQTLDVSVGTLNLSAGTSFNPKEEGLRVWLLKRQISHKPGLQ